MRKKREISFDQNIIELKLDWMRESESMILK